MEYHCSSQFIHQSAQIHKSRSNERLLCYHFRMSFYEVVGIASAVVFTSSAIPYIVATLRKKAVPHPVSWVLWAVIGVVTFYFTIKVGAHETLPFAFFNFLTPCIVAALSLRYWKGGFSRFDYLCLACSLLAILTYVMFHNAAFSLTLNLLADAFAFLPTIRKTYVDPFSENLPSWSLVTLGYSLSIIAAIPRFSYGVALFPIYLTLFGIIECALILRGRLQAKRKN